MPRSTRRSARRSRRKSHSKRHSRPIRRKSRSQRRSRPIRRKSRRVGSRRYGVVPTTPNTADGREPREKGIPMKIHMQSQRLGTTDIEHLNDLKGTIELDPLPQELTALNLYAFFMHRARSHQPTVVTYGIPEGDGTLRNFSRFLRFQYFEKPGPNDKILRYNEGDDLIAGDRRNNIVRGEIHFDVKRNLNDALVQAETDPSSEVEELSTNFQNLQVEQ